MSAEQIPLMQQTISMLTEEMKKVSTKVEEEAKKAQLHREESLRFHAEQRESDANFRVELLEKLEAKFAGKWTEKVLIFVGSTIGVILIGAIMTLIITR